MRENRPCGSEGGEAKSLPYPYRGVSSDSTVKQLSVVIVRLDRTIQYSRGPNVNREAAAYWITRLRG